MILYEKRLSVDELAGRMGITKSTVYKWKAQGVFLPGTFIKMGPNQRSDLQARVSKVEELLEMWQEKEDSRLRPAG